MCLSVATCLLTNCCFSEVTQNKTRIIITNLSNSNIMISQTSIKMLEFLSDKIFVLLGGRVLQQTVASCMGPICASTLTERFELTTLDVMSTDCTGSCTSNYRTITTGPTQRSRCFWFLSTAYLTVEKAAILLYYK
jgi:hypothetical protein